MKGRWDNLIWLPIFIILGYWAGGMLGGVLDEVGKPMGQFVGAIVWGLGQLHIVCHHPDIIEGTDQEFDNKLRIVTSLIILIFVLAIFMASTLEGYFK